MSQVTMPLEKRVLEDYRYEGRSEKSKEAQAIKHEAILMSVIRTKNSGIQNYVFLRELLIAKCMGKKTSQRLFCQRHLLCVPLM